MEKVNYEMETGDDFKQIINKLSQEVNEIIETGTFLGAGSTLVFAQTKKSVISIECNKNHYEQAINNLKDYPNVKLIHGHSLKKDEMFEFISTDDIYNKNLNIAMENPRDPKLFYITEISGDSPKENVFPELIDNEKKQLIFLDSAGGVGFLEFKKLIEIGEEKLKNKILFLDDINHVKHYRSVIELENMGYKFNRSQSNRWGWCNFNEVKQVGKKE